jgi:transposase
MDFKLELVEKSYQPGACVAQLAREHGINDNLLFMAPALQPPFAR